MWRAAAYPSLKPLASWVVDYQERVAFMRSWLTRGPPSCFWLPGELRFWAPSAPQLQAASPRSSVLTVVLLPRPPPPLQASSSLRAS
jgi:hypothetical protein